MDVNTQNAEINEDVENSFIDDGSDLFDGLFDEDNNLSEEDTHSEQEAANEADEELSLGNQNSQEEQVSAQPEKTVLKYNGNDVELTFDELKANAQKGLNYDYIKEKADEYKRKYDVLESYAKNNNISSDELLSAFTDEMESKKIQNYAAEYGVNEAGAKRMLGLESELEKSKSAFAEIEKQNKMRNDLKEFIKNHPDLDVAKLPESVFNDYSNNNVDFETSWAKIENAQLKEQLAALQKNQENRNTAVGSVQSEANNATVDAFLEGLNS